MENNEVAPDLGCHPFSSDSIVFNENSIASVIVASCSIDTDARRKQAHNGVFTLPDTDTDTDTKTKTNTDTEN